MNNFIQTIDAARVISVLDNRGSPKNFGLYLHKADNGFWVAIDNHAGKAWSDEFWTEKDAIDWLLQRAENDDIADERICQNTDFLNSTDNFYIYMADLTPQARERLNRVYLRQGWDAASDDELVTAVEVYRNDMRGTTA